MIKLLDVKWIKEVRKGRPRVHALDEVTCYFPCMDRCLARCNAFCDGHASYWHTSNSEWTAAYYSLRSVC